MKFGEWARNGRNYKGDNSGANKDANNDGIEYFEDTHKRGEYLGKEEMPKYSETPTMKQNTGMPLPQQSQYISPRSYQNVVVYQPRTPEDVQTLIDYLKRREPAIINLDNVDEALSQRILDFASGAIYALNGSVHRVAGNIFLLSPEGVEITVPYEI